jgi:hypothetical protein
MSGAVGLNVLSRTSAVSSNVVVPRIQFDPATYAVNEDVGSVQLTVKLDKANPHMATVFTLSTVDGSADEGDDYSAPIGPFSIVANATSTTINVPIIDDDDAENAELFSVTLTSAGGAALGSVKSANITINSEDSGQVIPNDNTYLPSAVNEEP